MILTIGRLVYAPPTIGGGLVRVGPSIACRMKVAEIAAFLAVASERNLPALASPINMEIVLSSNMCSTDQRVNTQLADIIS